MLYLYFVCVLLRSLQPYTDYVFHITPFWKTQRGTTVNTTVRTFSDKPSLPPTNVTLTAVNSTVCPRIYFSKAVFKTCDGFFFFVESISFGNRFLRSAARLQQPIHKYSLENTLFWSDSLHIKNKFYVLSLLCFYSLSGGWVFILSHPIFSNVLLDLQNNWMSPYQNYIICHYYVMAKYSHLCQT